MRKIKFKGKRLAQRPGQWIYGSLMVTQAGAFIAEGAPMGKEVDSSSVCEYTGCKDINGSDIYEGDIVEFVIDQSGKYPLDRKKEYMQVRFVNGCFDLTQGDKWIGLLWHMANRLVVRGNIFDNPELLNTEEI